MNKQTGYIAAFATSFLLMFAAQPVFAGNCSNPTQPEGYVMYNMDQHILQFCNGTNWISAGGGNTNSCSYMSGVCPTSNSSGVGCMSGQTISWGTVSCTVSSGVQTVIINSPAYLGGPLGGADSTEAAETAMKFCGDFGLGFSSDTVTTATGQWYDVRPTSSTDGTFYRTRGTASSSKITQVTCFDVLGIP